MNEVSQVGPNAVGASGLWGNLYGNSGSITQLKGRGRWKIVCFSALGIAGGLACGIFCVPAGIAVGLAIGVVPHFTRFGVLQVIRDADQEIRAESQKFCARSGDGDACNFLANLPHPVEFGGNSTSHSGGMADGVVDGGALATMHAVCFRERSVEADPNSKVEILNVYKSVLDAFNSNVSEEEAHEQAIQVINNSSLSNARKVAFIASAKAFAEGASAANNCGCSVATLTASWMEEYKAEADVAQQKEILRLCREVLRVFSDGKKDGTLTQATQIISDSSFSPERKAVFLVLVTEYAGKPSSATCASGQGAEEKVGILGRATRWFQHFMS
jgi:hypothetical protein